MGVTLDIRCVDAALRKAERLSSRYGQQHPLAQQAVADWEAQSRAVAGFIAQQFNELVTLL